MSQPASPRSLGERLLGSLRTRHELGLRLIAPILLAAPALFWVIDATQRATLTTVGRDQGIFQYIAWAVRQGAVDYRDVRDVNGPLIHLVHMLALALGGADEHRFHVLDLLMTGISFALIGWMLPGIVRGGVRLVERAAWAAAAWVVLSAQYAQYLYWNQAQRESFCDWFLLPSLALQLRPVGTAARESRRILAIAALSTVTLFGKSSFIFFPIMQLAVLLVSESNLTRAQRIKHFVAGGAIGSLVPLLYLLRFGDIVAFVKITLRDVPQVYRFIWARSAREILGDDGSVSSTTTALAVSAVLIALVVTRFLPRRMLALALAPLCGLASVVAQHKGFGYHFHPLTATTHIGLLVLVIMLWERFGHAPRSRALEQLAALGAIGGYALFVAASMRTSPHTRNVWILGGGETPKDREAQEYFDTFKTYDFFPWELRQGARYLADKLPPTARVQTYGMDPYLLFLAQRRSATPYIYAYDLNASAALDGGWQNRPTWLESERIRAWRDEHERDLLERLKTAPPEAFVFIDQSPLMSWQDAWEDFRHCCSETSRWVAEHYHPARSFDVVHIWLRDDLPIGDVEGDPETRSP